MTDIFDGGGLVQWFVMRDLKRANANQPAYKLLMERNIRVFTPLTWRIGTDHGRRVRKQVPLMPDLLFVYADRGKLDPIVESTPTLQYRWLRNTWRKPMTVSCRDMERFIRAVGSSDNPRYYLPEEITPAMHGRRIRIVGGLLDGYEGSLVTTRGSRVKRLLVDLQGYLSVAVEINPEFIEFVG